MEIWPPWLSSLILLYREPSLSGHFTDPGSAGNPSVVYLKSCLNGRVLPEEPLPQTMPCARVILNLIQVLMLVSNGGGEPSDYEPSHAKIRQHARKSLESRQPRLRNVPTRVWSQHYSFKAQARLDIINFLMKLIIQRRPWRGQLHMLRGLDNLPTLTLTTFSKFSEQSSSVVVNGNRLSLERLHQQLQFPDYRGYMFALQWLRSRLQSMTRAKKDIDAKMLFNNSERKWCGNREEWKRKRDDQEEQASEGSKERRKIARHGEKGFLPPFLLMLEMTRTSLGFDKSVSNALKGSVESQRRSHHF